LTIPSPWNISQQQSHLNDVRQASTKFSTNHLQYHPLFAAGEVVCSNVFEVILFQHYLNPSVLDVVKLLLGLRSARSNPWQPKQYESIDGSMVRSIDLPPGFPVSTPSFVYTSFYVECSVLTLFE
jgi:hypothetical protein